MQVSTTASPYRHASRERVLGRRSVFDIAGVGVGGDHFTIVAGPCSVESQVIMREVAGAVKAAGAQVLRGGAFKPRTSPYTFQGLGHVGLELLAEAKAETGLPVVSELMDVRHLEALAAVADVIQIGARNMHNYPLLVEAGRSGVPVLLKRGLSATVAELVLAAEYILNEGNERVILCERGIRTFEPSYRFTLDLCAVPVLKEQTHLPVFVDPSHAAGRRELVEPLSLAAAAVGADGLIVEVHSAPDDALCDGRQALHVGDFAGYVRRVGEAAHRGGKQAVQRGFSRFPRTPATA